MFDFIEKLFYNLKQLNQQISTPGSLGETGEGTRG